MDNVREGAVPGSERRQRGEPGHGLSEEQAVLYRPSPISQYSYKPLFPRADGSLHLVMLLKHSGCLAVGTWFMFVRQREENLREVPSSGNVGSPLYALPTAHLYTDLASCPLPW